MKVITDKEKNILLYLPEIQIDFDSMDKVEQDLKNILLRLKYYYFIDIQGFYQVKIYKDIYYGLILELTKDTLDYFDYYDGEIDMRIELIESDFLYEVRDILELPKNILKKSEIYIDNNTHYIKIKEKIDMSQVLEYAYNLHYKSSPFLLKEKNRISY